MSVASDQEDEIESLKKRVSELEALLHRLEGAGMFIKLCIYIGAPAAAFIYWAKDHIKL